MLYPGSKQCFFPDLDPRGSRILHTSNKMDTGTKLKILFSCCLRSQVQVLIIENKIPRVMMEKLSIN
jgi:hypothetical protein